MTRQQLLLPSQTTLQTLEPEEALARLHHSVLPHAHTLKTISVPSRKLGVLWMGLTFILLCLLFFSAAFEDSLPIALPFISGLAVGFWLLSITLAPLIFVVTLLHNAPRQRRNTQTTDALSAFVGLCHLTESVPYLLDFLVWLAPSAPPQHLRSLNAALVRLLPRVGEDELQRLLTPERRKALRRVCERQENTDLVTVALLALASVQDSATVPLAKRLRKTPLTADAAEAFLDALK